MKYRHFAFTLAWMFLALPASAFESRNPAPNRPQLKMELEEIPSTTRENFDRYVRNLAVEGQKNATPEEKARQDDAVKERQAKVVNPLPLLRW